jgi:hypothetical protein
LTETDLEKIGLPLGPRKRILKAIAKLGGSEKASAVASPSAPAPAGDAAERLQLTVMFCDLVGSTADPSSFQPLPKLSLSGIGGSRGTDDEDSWQIGLRKPRRR